MADADRLNDAEDAEVEGDYHDALIEVLDSDTIEEARTAARNVLRRWRHRR